ncbi:PD-(D/E)XK nuclease family protein [Sediminihaliea albiluteola]|uniref:PD-(D/E)XK nuclease family protein n=1 Tax=Sediminihaliea albiluteola TaxID=2758564 RepID=UPI002E286D43|nr:PD-(D/E)XK nuclease family protein [Sediminihaliea albiluteola]
MIATRPLYNIEQLQGYIEQGYQLLTPNLRLARRIKAEWDRSQAASGARVWRPLAVRPLEQWLYQQWLSRSLSRPSLRRIPIGQGQALALWRQIIRNQIEHSGLQLLQPDAAAAMAEQARGNLLRWQISLQQEAIAAEFALDQDCATFLQWCQAFEAALEERGLATTLDAIAMLAQDGSHKPTVKALLLDFDEVAPLFRHCLAQLCSDVEELQAAAEQASLQAFAFADQRSELLSIARWIRHLHQAEPNAAIGVVLGDMRADRSHLEYLLRREFDCLNENYAQLPVNFSTGWPLAEVPLVRDALLALNMSRNQLNVNELLSLLRSRFVNLPDKHSALGQKFIVRLFDQGLEQMPAATVRNLACQVTLGEQRGLALGEILQCIAQRRELGQRMRPSQWLEHFDAVLQLWAWPGPSSLDSLEYQQLEQWQSMLESYAAYDMVCDHLDLPGALKLLAQCCAETMFQAQTSDSSIQVLGPLEAAGLSFDHLWLAGMQASQWPAPARPNPLLPMALQRRCGMPHASAEREWDYSSKLLAQYRRSSGQLYASYSRELNGAPELPSALLNDFEWGDMPVPDALPEQWLKIWEQRDMEFLEDHQAPAVSELELSSIKGGSGLIEDQSNCAFRAFAKRRLSVQSLSEPSLALSASERGVVMHDALYALWGELGSAKGLLAVDDAKQAEIIERAVAAAVAAVPESRRSAVGEAYLAQESAYLAQLLSEWLEVERERADFVVSAREQEASFELKGLPMTLRVDRIDTLADGSQMIIDYKSSPCSKSSWLGERPSQPQLPLYGMVSTEAVGALAFAQVRPRECQYTGIGDSEAADAAKGIEVDIAKAMRGKAPCQDWQDLRSYWQDCLERLAEDFLSGAAMVDPQPNSCTWCGLQALCRVGAAYLEIDEDALDDGQEL